MADREEITITRVYAASPERVWRAWTEPAEIARWWGKRGWNTPPESVTLDVRPGGVFRLNSIAEADGAQMPMEATYVEVDPPARLVFSRDGLVSTVTLTTLGGGRTEMVFHTTTTLPDDVRKRAIAGLGSAFERLGESLTD